MQKSDYDELRVYVRSPDLVSAVMDQLTELSKDPRNGIFLDKIKIVSEPTHGNIEDTEIEFIYYIEEKEVNVEDIE